MAGQRREAQPESMEEVPTVFGPGDFHAAVWYAGVEGRNSAAGDCTEGDDEDWKGKTS